MFNNFQVYIAICKTFGYLNLFITITCNKNWPEIRDFIPSRGCTTSYRPDTMCRMKLDEMMTDFKKREFFGKVNVGNLSFLPFIIITMIS